MKIQTAWASSDQVEDGHHGSKCIFVEWEKPPVGWIAVNIDEAAKGCPGQASCASVFWDCHGQ